MREEFEFKGKSPEEAIEKAKLELGEKADDMEFEIIKMPTSGFFGIGASPAIIKVIIETPDPAPAKPEKVEKKVEKADKRDNRSSVKTERPEKNFRAEKTDKNDKKENKEKQEAKVVSPNPDATAKGGNTLEFLKGVIKNFGIEAEIAESKCDDGSTLFTISGKEAGVLIGHHGDTLDSLQYLANLTANHRREEENRDYQKIVIDIEGYRAKREETLRVLARRVADKVIKYHKSVTLEPMNPSERRIIHSEIQEIEGVCTTSVGSDDNRKVVVYLEGTSPSSDRFRYRGGKNYNRSRKNHNNSENSEE